MKKIIYLIGSLLGVALGVLPLLALAGGQAAITINPNIPGLSNVSTVGPCGWIVSFYTFALLFAGILAFGAIVYGGIKYAASEGNASSQSEGRSWIWSALIGLLLLAGAYLILSTVNPNLVKCALGGAGSGGSGASSRCQAPTTGPCSSAQLQGSCLGNSQAAAGVCNVESSGNPNAGGDIGDDGNAASLGLFQINISANTIPYNCNPNSSGCLNCPSAFSNPYTGTNPHTHVTNQALYRQCVTAAENPSTNIQQACAMSNNGTRWSLWGPSTITACGL